MTTHKEALNSPNGEAQPSVPQGHKKEPVACASLCVECTKRGDWVCAKAIPPQRDSSATPHTWVGLTDMERHDIMIAHYARTELLAHAIEAKLKAKNERLEKNT